MVGDAGQNVSLGNKLKKTAELFDIISNNGDVDHPLCEECTDTLLERLVYPQKMLWIYIQGVSKVSGRFLKKWVWHPEESSHAYKIKTAS